MPIIFDTVSLFKENQRFFLNSTEIPGIQTLEASYEVNASPLKHIGGQDNEKFIPVGPQIGKVSISNILVGNDLWLTCTGETGVNGYIMKSPTDFSNNFSFVSGYLTYYHSQCNLGQLHRIDTTFDVYRNIGGLVTDTPDMITNIAAIQTSTANIPFKIPSAETTDIILDDIETNKILSYDVAITINRNPIYTLGSRFPKEVKTNWPIEVQCSFQIEIDSYSARNLNQYPVQATYRNVSITTRDIYDSTPVLSYNFSGMLLVSEIYRAGIDNTVIVNAIYRKSVNGPLITGSMIEDSDAEIPPILPIVQDPTFYWKMDELGETNRIDSIAGLVLVENGGLVTDGIGKFGNAVSFFAQVNVNPELSTAFFPSFSAIPELAFLGIGFDFCFWVKFTDLGNTAAQAILTRYRLYNDLEEDIGYFTLDYFTNLNQFIIFISSETDSDSFALNFTPTLGTWYFIRAFYNHTNGTYGIQINNGTATISTNPIILPISQLGRLDILQLGSAAGVSNEYLVDEFGWWLNQRLSDFGATSIYNGGNGTTWPF